jgi:hypothetical protein
METTVCEFTIVKGEATALKPCTLNRHGFRVTSFDVSCLIVSTFAATDRVEEYPAIKYDKLFITKHP